MSERPKRSGTSALRRTAAEVKRYRMLMRFTPVILGVLAAILIITYVVTVFYSRYGAFTVTVNKFSNIKAALSLSETADFNTPTSRLNSKASKDITNISTASLPENLDTVEGGEHNGKNYVAYTFFCKNTGKEAVTYQYQLFISNMTLGIQHAVRVRLYVDGEYKDYAKPSKLTGEAEPNTEAFLTGSIIAQGDIEGFQPGDVTRFTVVIWLEGDDPECIDDVLGGQFAVDMSMTIIGTEEDGEEAA